MSGGLARPRCPLSVVTYCPGMDADIWVPITVASIGALFVTVNTVVSRFTAKGAAVLGARQRRRDVDLETLSAYGDALFAAANAVQSYMWYGSDEMHSRMKVSPEEWAAARPEVERAQHAVELLRFAAGALPSGGPGQWLSVYKAHDEVLELLISVVHAPGSGGRTAADIWGDATSRQPDAIVRAMSAVNELKRELVEKYPVTFPKLSLWSMRRRPS